MKAIIPAAGLGTRFLPIAKAVPKEMMPVGDRPVIHHVVHEALSAGFTEILVVISHGKECIPHYFASDPQLEQHLEALGKLEALEAVRETVRAGTHLKYVFQPKMRGLGDAVMMGRDFIQEGEFFAVLLGDTIVSGQSALPAMVRAWQDHGLASVAIEPCDPGRVSRYGIAGGHAMETPGLFRLDQIVEKPAPHEAPQLHGKEPLPPHAFAARYLFGSELFHILDSTPPGANGEVQLTDAMAQNLKKSGLLGVITPGKRLDIGNPAGLIEASLAHHPQF